MGVAIFLLLLCFASFSRADETCSSLFSALKPLQRIGREAGASGQIVFLRRENYRGRVIKLDENTFMAGKSYTALVVNGRLFIGEDYLGPGGAYAKSHEPLFEDASRREAGESHYEERAGAIKVYSDGTIDVAGFHSRHGSSDGMKAIARILRLALPGVRIRRTPGRLTDLAKYTPILQPGDEPETSYQSIEMTMRERFMSR
jgi:hypothetical protein